MHALLASRISVARLYSFWQAVSSPASHQQYHAYAPAEYLVHRFVVCRDAPTSTTARKHLGDSAYLALLVCSRRYRVTELLRPCRPGLCELALPVDLRGILLSTRSAPYVHGRGHRVQILLLLRRAGCKAAMCPFGSTTVRRGQQAMALRYATLAN